MKKIDIDDRYQIREDKYCWMLIDKISHRNTYYPNIRSLLKGYTDQVLLRSKTYDELMVILDKIEEKINSVGWEGHLDRK